MTHDEIDARVRLVITDVTHRDLSTVASDDDLVSVLGVDSLQSLQVLALVEQRLDVRFRDDELIDLRTIARIADAARAAPMTAESHEAKGRAAREVARTGVGVGPHATKERWPTS